MNIIPNITTSIVEALGVALLVCILYIEQSAISELLSLLESGFFTEYRMKGGSIAAFMLSRYVIDVFYNAMLIFMYCIFVYGLGFELRHSWPDIILWIIFNPFVGYTLAFAYAQYIDA